MKLSNYITKSSKRAKRSSEKITISQEISRKIWRISITRKTRETNLCGGTNKPLNGSRKSSIAMTQQLLPFCAELPPFTTTRTSTTRRSHCGRMRYKGFSGSMKTDMSSPNPGLPSLPTLLMSTTSSDSTIWHSITTTNCCEKGRSG